MKKLLPILICLFVSFEVKSESDDLSGKKLLCSDNNSFLPGNEFISNGFEFISQYEVYVYDIRYTSEIDDRTIYTLSLDRNYSSYTTTVKYIKVVHKSLYKNKYHQEQELYISRQDLNDGHCKIFKDDLMVFFELHLEKLQKKNRSKNKELKLKQKI